MKIIKQADTIKAEEYPKVDVLATYVESLKMYLEDNSINPKLADLIETLPSPTKIIKDFSYQECKILFETVNYLWRQITGGDIIDENKIYDKPETLFGNYWIMSNGVLLHGINHYSIVKQNTNLFSTLLNLNGFALQQYLAGDPHELIRYIIENGAVRVFVTKDKRAYFQMSEDTYADWGKAKVKKYEFKPRIVRIIDFKSPYSGWTSGIAVKL